MRNYSQTLKELYDLQRFSIKMGLDNITSLCKILNNPYKAYSTIHIAGTNGKGSTAIILQKILNAHKLDVGLYTSPHLIDFCERIRVNDKLIDKQYVTEIWPGIKNSVYSLKATFFDTSTTIAFSYFKEKKVDVAIIETGLGGRLDSTNIIEPEVGIITPVDIDHSKQLGTKLEQVAYEKAGIIKMGMTLFLGKQSPAVRNVFKEYNDKTNKQVYLDDSVVIENVELNNTCSVFDFHDNLHNKCYKKVYLNIPASFQIENALLAYLAAYWYLKSVNIDFKEDRFRDALKNVYWPGRLQKVSTFPDIYFDVSHNVSGFRNTLDFIRKVYDNDHLYLLIGLLADKDYKAIVKLIDRTFDEIVVTEPESERALEAVILKQQFLKSGINVKLIKEKEKAFEFLTNKLPKEHKLFVMGSHFLIGGLLKKFNKKS